MDDDQLATSERLAVEEKTLFVCRMIRIVEDARERIGEHGGGLFEGHAMFANVRLGLTRPTFTANKRYSFTALATELRYYRRDGLCCLPLFAAGKP